MGLLFENKMRCFSCLNRYDLPLCRGWQWERKCFYFQPLRSSEVYENHQWMCHNTYRYLTLSCSNNSFTSVNLDALSSHLNSLGMHLTKLWDSIFGLIYHLITSALEIGVSIFGDVCYLEVMQIVLVQIKSYTAIELA